MQIGADTNWASVSATDGYTMAVRDDGSLWAWGRNSWGQLGDGTITTRYAPVRIGADYNWESVSAGGFHTVAIRIDGSLWAWGENTNGSIGDGTTIQALVPVRIGADYDWVSVSAGGGYTMAIRSDGSLWAWGLNSNGELGDGTTTRRLIPVRIGTATNWAGVSAGGAGTHTVAIRTDGSLWAWGYNWAGQLGDGTTTNRTAPVRIGTATNWATVSTGINHTVATRTDGSLWAWGDNWYWQLGDGTRVEERRTPTRIDTDTNWVSVSAGNQITMAIRNDDSLWAWGSGAQGDIIGDGSGGSRVPMSIIPLIPCEDCGVRPCECPCEDCGMRPCECPCAYCGAYPCECCMDCDDGSCIICNPNRAVTGRGCVLTHNSQNYESRIGFRLNLENERVERRYGDSDYVPFEVRSFTIDAVSGVRWRNVPANRDFNIDILPRLLNRAMPSLMVSDRPLYRGQPEVGGSRISFPAIEARPRAARLVVNYDWRDADGNLIYSDFVPSTAISATAPHGRWVLTMRATRDNPAVQIDYSQFLIAPATRLIDGRVRNIRAGQVENWSNMAGMADIRNVQPIGEGNRVTRTRYFVRGMSSSVLTETTPFRFIYTPMPRESRITISSALRAPNIRPHATNNTLNIRRGVMLYYSSTLVGDNITGLSQGIADLTSNPVFVVNGVITNPNATALEGLRFRTGATARRPASMPTEAVTIQGNATP